MRSDTVPTKVESKKEVQKGIYTNYWIGYQENGYPEVKPINLKALYDFIEEGKEHIFKVNWFYNRKTKKESTYICDVAKSFGKDGFLFCLADAERIAEVTK